MKSEEQHDCPLCGLDFAGAACHSTCPFSKGCEMVRCPRCAYEFVEKGFVVSMIRRLFRSPERTSE
jgi:hypothetical protein